MSRAARMERDSKKTEKEETETTFGNSSLKSELFQAQRLTLRHGQNTQSHLGSRGVVAGASGGLRQSGIKHERDVAGWNLNASISTQFVIRFKTR